MHEHDQTNTEKENNNTNPNKWTVLSIADCGKWYTANNSLHHIADSVIGKRKQDDIYQLKCTIYISIIYA